MKGYASHEKKLMEEISSLRSRCMSAEGPDAKLDAENELSLGLRKLIAVAEAYPQLRASENFSGLQNSLNEIEDQIQLARRYYNGTARDFNILLESFPSSLVGKNSPSRRRPSSRSNRPSSGRRRRSDSDRGRPIMARRKIIIIILAAVATLVCTAVRGQADERILRFDSTIVVREDGSSG